MDRNQEAIARLRAAIALNPNVAAAHLALGRLLASTGEGGESERHLERFKQISLQEETEKQARRRADEMLEDGKNLPGRTSYARRSPNSRNCSRSIPAPLQPTPCFRRFTFR